MGSERAGRSSVARVHSPPRVHRQRVEVLSSIGRQRHVFRADVSLERAIRDTCPRRSPSQPQIPIPLHRLDSVSTTSHHVRNVFSVQVGLRTAIVVMPLPIVLHIPTRSRFATCIEEPGLYGRRLVLCSPTLHPSHSVQASCAGVLADILTLS